MRSSRESLLQNLLSLASKEKEFVGLEVEASSTTSDPELEKAASSPLKGVWEEESSKDERKRMARLAGESDIFYNSEADKDIERKIEGSRRDSLEESTTKMSTLKN